MNQVRVFVALVAVIALMLSGRLSAQTGASLADTDRQFNEAMQSGTNEKLAEFFAEDVVVMVPGGPILRGRQQVARLVLFAAPKPEFSVVSKTIDLAESGDLGYSAGINRIEGPAGSSSGKWVHVWKRVQGQWKIAYAIANTDPPAAK